MAHNNQPAFFQRNSQGLLSLDRIDKLKAFLENTKICDLDIIMNDR